MASKSVDNVRWVSLYPCFRIYSTKTNPVTCQQSHILSNHSASDDSINLSCNYPILLIHNQPGTSNSTNQRLYYLADSDDHQLREQLRTAQAELRKQAVVVEFEAKAYR